MPATTPAILHTRCGDQFVSEDIILTVAHRNLGYGEYSPGMPAVEVTATSDGRQMSREWHEGDESGVDIYVERYTADGRVFHGWIDSVSRQIVQAG